MLLFKLGYVERVDFGITVSSGSMLRVQKQALLALPRAVTAASPRAVDFNISRPWFALTSTKVTAPARRSTLQICILGDNGVGKSSFVWNTTGLRAPGIGGDVEMGADYAKYSDSVVVGGCALRLDEVLAMSQQRNAPSRSSAAAEAHKILLSAVLPPTFYASVAAVPLEHVEKWLERSAASCDLVVLMFQCASAASLRTAMALESKLPTTVPRLYIATKTDTILSIETGTGGSGGSSGGVGTPGGGAGGGVFVPGRSAHSSSGSLKSGGGGGGGSGGGEYGNDSKVSREQRQAAHEAVLQTATLHISDNNLPPLALISTLTGDGMTDARSLIVDVATDPIKGMPRKNVKVGQSFMPSLKVVVATVAAISVTTLLAVYNKEVKDWINKLWSNFMNFRPTNILQQ